MDLLIATAKNSTVQKKPEKDDEKRTMKDLEELKELSPENRIKKLKEIEEQSRKEIEEAQKLMSESLREIEVEQDIRERIPIPQLTSVDIDSLFGNEEKEMFKAKRFEGRKEAVKENKQETALEEVVRKEKAELKEGEARPYTQPFEEAARAMGTAYKGSEGMGSEEDPMREAYSHAHEEEGPKGSYKTMGDEVREMASLGEQVSKKYKR